MKQLLCRTNVYQFQSAVGFYQVGKDVVDAGEMALARCLRGAQAPHSIKFRLLDRAEAALAAIITSSPGSPEVDPP